MGLLDFLNNASQTVSNRLDDAAGLLQSDPTVQLGLGLLQAAPTGMSFGRGLAHASQFASERQEQQQILEMRRQQLEAANRQQKATKRLQGLLSSPAANVPAAIRNPNAMQNEQQEIMGLLSQINPQATTQALLQSAFPAPTRMPADITTTRLLTGLEPGQPGFREAFQQIANPRDASQELADMLNATRLEQAQAESQRETEVFEANKQRRSVGRTRALDDIQGIVQLLQQTENTAAQPGGLASTIGQGASLLAGVQNLMGASGQDAEKIATQIEKLDKGFGRLMGKTIDDAFLGSDSRLEFFRSQNPGTQQQVGTNLSVLNDILEDIKDEQKIAGESTEETNRLLEVIKRLSTPVSGSPATAIPPGFRVVSDGG